MSITAKELREWPAEGLCVYTSYAHKLADTIEELTRVKDRYQRLARNVEEALDNVRAAMGFDITHYLVLPSDVEELVQAVEKQGPGSPAREVLERLRKRYANSSTPDLARPLSGAAERAAIAAFLRKQAEHYPPDVFIPPVGAAHCETRDGCSAHALRWAAEAWAQQIEERRHLPEPPP